MAQPLDEYEVWKQVIERLRAERPDPATVAGIAVEAITPALTAKQADRVRGIDFAVDIQGLRDWFRTLLKTEPPDENIDAFYFGLYDAAIGVLKNKEAPAMYVGGSDRFDPEDRYCEWACDPRWFPKRRYPGVRAFRELAAALPPTGLLRAIVADAFVFALAQDLTTHTDPDLLLGNRPWRAVASGYDSGDAYLVGYITRSGFTTSQPSA